MASEDGSSLTGRKAGLLAGHRQELALLQQVPRASCSSTLRLTSTGWDSPGGRKPAGRDTAADRSRGRGWRGDRKSCLSC